MSLLRIDWWVPLFYALALSSPEAHAAPMSTMPAHHELPQRSNHVTFQLFLQSQRHPSQQLDSTPPSRPASTRMIALGWLSRHWQITEETERERTARRQKSRGCWGIQCLLILEYLEETVIADFLWSRSNMRHCLPSAGNGNNQLCKLPKDSKRVWQIESQSRLQPELSKWQNTWIFGEPKKKKKPQSKAIKT